MKSFNNLRGCPSCIGGLLCDDIEMQYDSVNMVHYPKHFLACDSCSHKEELVEVTLRYKEKIIKQKMRRQ